MNVNRSAICGLLIASQGPQAQRVIYTATRDGALTLYDFTVRCQLLYFI